MTMCKVSSLKKTDREQTNFKCSSVSPGWTRDCKLCSAHTDWARVWTDFKPLSVSSKFCRLSCYKSCTYCTRAATKERRKSGCCKTASVIKIYEQCFLYQSCSVKNVPNVQNVGQDLPVGAKLHQFRETLGARPKVIKILQEGYTLPFRTRPNLTRAPTIISCCVIPHRNLYLMEAFNLLMNKKCSRVGQKSRISRVLQVTIFFFFFFFFFFFYTDIYIYKSVTTLSDIQYNPYILCTIQSYFQSFLIKKESTLPSQYFYPEHQYRKCITTTMKGP